MDQYHKQINTYVGIKYEIALKTIQCYFEI